VGDVSRKPGTHAPFATARGPCCIPDSSARATPQEWSEYAGYPKHVVDKRAGVKCVIEFLVRRDQLTVERDSERQINAVVNSPSRGKSASQERTTSRRRLRPPRRR
jgi:hypothetical protein